MKGMMVNISISTFLIGLSLTSCDNKNKEVWIPTLNKSYSNVINLEKDSLKPIFVQYLGFAISVDSFYLNRGYIDQKLDLGDVSDSVLINEFKAEPINEIKFLGDTMNIDKFEKRYSLNLKKVGDRYDVYNQNGMNIGHLKISNQTYEFVVKAI